MRFHLTFRAFRRRPHKDLILLFKIVYGLSDLNFFDYYVFVNTGYNLRRNSIQIKQKNPPNLNTEQFLNSFFVRVIKVWNILPDDIIRSASMDVFKRKLRTFSFTTVSNIVLFVYANLRYCYTNCCCYVFFLFFFFLPVLHLHTLFLDF